MLKVCSLLCLVGHVSQEVNDLDHLRSLQLILSPRHVEGLHVVDEEGLKLQAQIRVLLVCIEVLQHVQEERLNLDALLPIKYELQEKLTLPGKRLSKSRSTPTDRGLASSGSTTK